MFQVEPPLPAGVLVILIGLMCSCARSMETSPRPEDCLPVQSQEAKVGFGSESRILPGDYTIVAVSMDGRRASGAMRLFRSSPADSGRSYSGEWMHVAVPEDTVAHPLYGVTTVDFERTLVTTDASIEALAQEVNPVYPQVLVQRRRRATGERVSWTLYVDTVRNRGPDIVFDGGGVWLSVVKLEADFFGWYHHHGIISTDHGFYCAWRQGAAFPS